MHAYQHHIFCSLLSLLVIIPSNAGLCCSKQRVAAAETHSNRTPLMAEVRSTTRTRSATAIVPLMPSAEHRIRSATESAISTLNTMHHAHPVMTVTSARDRTAEPDLTLLLPTSTDSHPDLIASSPTSATTASNIHKMYEARERLFLAASAADDELFATESAVLKRIIADGTSVASPAATPDRLTTRSRLSTQHKDMGVLSSPEIYLLETHHGTILNFLIRSRSAGSAASEKDTPS